MVRARHGVGRLGSLDGGPHRRNGTPYTPLTPHIIPPPPPPPRPQPQHDYMEVHRKRHGERLDREERL